MSDDKVGFSFRVEESLKKSFEKCAIANDRTASQLLRDFMRDYVKKNAQGDLLKDKKK